MTQLTPQAPLSQSPVSRLVAQLEADGLVRHGPEERDARVVVTLADDGLTRLRRAQDMHRRG